MLQSDAHEVEKSTIALKPGMESVGRVASLQPKSRPISELRTPALTPSSSQPHCNSFPGTSALSEIANFYGDHRQTLEAWLVIWKRLCELM